MVMYKTSQGKAYLPKKLSQQKYYKSYISQSMNEKKKNNCQDIVQNCLKCSWFGTDKCKQNTFVKPGQQKHGISQYLGGSLEVLFF